MLSLSFKYSILKNLCLAAVLELMQTNQLEIGFNDHSSKCLHNFLLLVGYKFTVNAGIYVCG